MEKHELSKVDFETIAFKALLQSRLDPVTADKIVDLRECLGMLTLAGWRLRKRLRSRAAGWGNIHDKIRARACSALIESGGFTWSGLWGILSALIRFEERDDAEGLFSGHEGACYCPGGKRRVAA